MRLMMMMEKVNPGNLEKQLFGVLRTLIAWAPRAGTGHKGGDPTGLPECHPFAMEICKEMALPPRSTLGTSKNNCLEAFKL